MYCVFKLLAFIKFPLRQYKFYSLFWKGLSSNPNNNIISSLMFDGGTVSKQEAGPCVGLWLPFCLHVLPVSVDVLSVRPVTKWGLSWVYLASYPKQLGQNICLIAVFSLNDPFLQTSSWVRDMRLAVYFWDPFILFHNFFILGSCLTNFFKLRKSSLQCNLPLFSNLSNFNSF